MTYSFSLDTADIFKRFIKPTLFAGLKSQALVPRSNTTPWLLSIIFCFRASSQNIRNMKIIEYPTIKHPETTLNDHPSLLVIIFIM